MYSESTLRVVARVIKNKLKVNPKLDVDATIKSFSKFTFTDEDAAAIKAYLNEVRV